MRYAIVIEQTETGYSAYAPDLPGLGVAGFSIEEVRELISRGIAIYIDELKSHGERVTKPSAVAEYVKVDFVTSQ